MPLRFIPNFFYPIPWYDAIGSFMKQFDFSALIRLYSKMDNTYNKVAAQYGFHCTGCKDNCCTSLFFHHTFVEKAFLLHGFFQMDTGVQKKIRQTAADYVSKTFSSATTGNSLKLMCPLICQDRCSLYFFRPMICRLHGLPHELHPPGRQKIRGPGCNTGQFDSKPYIAFDRTPFYVKMAELEHNFQHKHNKAGRPRQTIAQMLANPEI